MSVFLASTTVTVLRGTSAPNEYGDEVSAMTSVASCVPAAVTEGTSSTSASNNQTTFQPSDMRRGVVETFTIRLRPGTEVIEDDRLVDERTGAVYQVRAVYSPHSIVGMADVRVIAARTGAASQPVNG